MGGTFRWVWTKEQNYTNRLRISTEKNNGREIRHDWPKVAQASCLCDEKNRRSLFRIPNPNEFCGHGKKQWPRNPA
jgi:hypothetical protein